VPLHHGGGAQHGKHCPWLGQHRKAGSSWRGCGQSPGIHQVRPGRSRTRSRGMLLPVLMPAVLLWTQLRQQCHRGHRSSSSSCRAWGPP